MYAAIIAGVLALALILTARVMLTGEQKRTEFARRAAELHPPAAETPKPSSAAYIGPIPYVPVTIPESTRTPEEMSVWIPEQEPEPAMTLLGRYDIVGYDLCADCCGETDGITRSGAVATVGRTAAANGLPFGTRLYIDGVGERVVEDRGYLADGVIDVLCNNHAECYAITGVYDVYIVEDTGI